MSLDCEFQITPIQIATHHAVACYAFWSWGLSGVAWWASYERRAFSSARCEKKWRLKGSWSTSSSYSVSIGLRQRIVLCVCTRSHKTVGSLPVAAHCSSSCWTLGQESTRVSTHNTWCERKLKCGLKPKLLVKLTASIHNQALYITMLILCNVTMNAISFKSEVSTFSRAASQEKDVIPAAICTLPTQIFTSSERL